MKGEVANCAYKNCNDYCKYCKGGYYAQTWHESYVYDRSLERDVWCEGYAKCTICPGGNWCDGVKSTPCKPGKHAY